MFVVGTTDVAGATEFAICHDRNSLYLPAGPQSGAGDGAALVVP
jgi:hypothetical protein